MFDTGRNFAFQQTTYGSSENFTKRFLRFREHFNHPLQAIDLKHLPELISNRGE